VKFIQVLKNVADMINLILLVKYVRFLLVQMNAALKILISQGVIIAKLTQVVKLVVLTIHLSPGAISV
jgi:hypothetical protein